MGLAEPGREGFTSFSVFFSLSIFDSGSCKVDPCKGHHIRCFCHRLPSPSYAWLYPNLCFVSVNLFLFPPCGQSRLACWGMKKKTKGGVVSPFPCAVPAESLGEVCTVHTDRFPTHMAEKHPWAVAGDMDGWMVLDSTTHHPPRLCRCGPGLRFRMGKFAVTDGQIRGVVVSLQPYGRQTGGKGEER